MDKPDCKSDRVPHEVEKYNPECVDDLHSHVPQAVIIRGIKEAVTVIMVACSRSGSGLCNEGVSACHTQTTRCIWIYQTPMFNAACRGPQSAYA